MIKELVRGGTFALSWGRWGGFYVHRWRICLGWLALTYLPVEIDDLMREYVGEAEPIMSERTCQ